MYRWEQGVNSRKKAGSKLTGTIIHNGSNDINTSFESLLKIHNILATDFMLDQYRMEDHQDSQTQDHDKLKKQLHTSLMTKETVSILKNKLKFDELLPTQAQCYRPIFMGRDVILHSLTGSGKTLAYLLPIIERHRIFRGMKSTAESGCFLLIFIFSTELALQIKLVINQIYTELKVGIAEVDDLITNSFDIIIGSIHQLSPIIHPGSSQSQGEMGHRKRARAETDEDVTQANSMVEDPDHNEDGDDDSQNSESEDADSLVNDDEKGLDLSNIRCIVVDEVDKTLGPRFSKTGTLMKQLLRWIRRQNQSSTPGLLSDYHSHHYVLCGATIPNWVLKSGFLGLKKYYFQLVKSGMRKLPQQLECFIYHSSQDTRVTCIQNIVREHPEFGRVVIFGTLKQLNALSLAFTSMKPKPSHIIYRILTKKQTEQERIQAIQDFNSFEANILLCTDIAARGLDLVNVDLVCMLYLNSDVMASETFLHRAGRTARVRKPGKCLWLVDENKEKDLIDAVRIKNHLVFHYMPSLSSVKGVIDYRMVVGNPFYAESGEKNGKLGPIYESIEILKRELGEDYQRVVDPHIENDNPNCVVFGLPVELTPIVQKKLWKYNVKKI